MTTRVSLRLLCLCCACCLMHTVLPASGSDPGSGMAAGLRQGPSGSRRKESSAAHRRGHRALLLLQTARPAHLQGSGHHRPAQRALHPAQDRRRPARAFGRGAAGGILSNPGLRLRRGKDTRLSARFHRGRGVEGAVDKLFFTSTLAGGGARIPIAKSMKPNAPSRWAIIRAPSRCSSRSPRTARRRRHAEQAQESASGSGAASGRPLCRGAAAGRERQGSAGRRDRYGIGARLPRHQGGAGGRSTARDAGQPRRSARELRAAGLRKTCSIRRATTIAASSYLSCLDRCENLIGNYADTERGSGGDQAGGRDQGQPRMDQASLRSNGRTS